MEELDINIIHCLGKQHGNVNGLTRAYEGVGDVSKGDDLSDATIKPLMQKEHLRNINKSFNIWMAGGFELVPQRLCEHKLLTRVEITQ
jgi:hypothetical protein